MKTLEFDYFMQIDYSVEISRCHFTIKCFPKDNERQKIRDLKISLCPETSYSWGTDGMRNKQIYGINELPHKTFSFHLTGIAEAGSADYEEYMNPDLDMVFAHPHGLNVSGSTIKSYYEKILPEMLQDASLSMVQSAHKQMPEKMQERYEFAKAMMHRLHQDFRYQKNSTTIQTGAEEAFSGGCGVCQDFAHVYIALMHLAKIPARYVTGLIIGEGASHAWVEILLDDRWYGLDPTNDIEVSDQHIKIGVGRDAGDCMINRGIMHGGSDQIQTINVSVKEIV